MIEGISPIVVGLLGNVIKPRVEVFFRKINPGFEDESFEHDFIETPDIVDVGYGLLRGEKTANGVFKATYAGWNNPIPGDSVSTLAEDAIVRVYQPKALNTNSDSLYFYYRTATDGSFTVPRETITLSSPYTQMPRSRGGVLATATDMRYYYVTSSGAVAYLSAGVGGLGWSSSPTVVETDTYYVNTYGVTIAPISNNTYFALYFLGGSRHLYLDMNVGGTYMIHGQIIGTCHDDVVHWSVPHWFDAVEVGVGDYCLVASQSRQGASYSYWVYDNIVSDPNPILGFDDADWTGTLRVASLNLINNRIYAVAGQRFLLSDNSYSDELWTILWAGDDKHWAQPRHLALDVTAFYGKVNVLGESVYVVSPTRAAKGIRTVDFGGEANFDMSDYCSGFSMQRQSDMSGSLHRHQFTSSSPDDFLNYAEQIVTKVGIGTGVEDMVPLGVAWVADWNRTTEVARDFTEIPSRGSLSVLLDRTQFTDEMLDRSTQVRFDMDNNSVLNRGGSIWHAKDGILWTHLTNQNDESIAYISERITGNFELRAGLLYEPDVKSFGFIFLAGVPDTELKFLGLSKDATGNYLYSPDDVADNNFVLIKMTASSGTVTIDLVRRTATWVNDAWEFLDVSILPPGTPKPTFAWEPNTYHNFKLTWHYGVVSLWQREPADWVAEFSDVYVPVTAPKSFLVGLYQAGYGGKVKESASSGKTMLLIEGTEDWPATGTIQFPDLLEYTFVRNGEELSVTPPLSTYQSKGTAVSVSTADIACDWLQLASTHPRWSVADICRHISMRSGIYLSVDKYAPPLNVGWVAAGGAGYYTGSAWACTTEFVLTSPVSTGELVAEIYWTNDSAARSTYLEWRLWGGSTRIQFHPNRAVPFVKIIFADGSNNSSPIRGIYTKGWFRIVATNEWVHCFINRNHVASMYAEAATSHYGRLSVGGTGVSLWEVNIEVGYDVPLIGIWDGSTPARQVLADVLNGRPYVITETNNATLRLQHIDAHDDLGTLPLSVMPMIGSGSVWGDLPSALVVQGAYEWTMTINRDLIRERGLLWGRIENQSLLTLEDCRTTASTQMRRNKGSQASYFWRGRLHPGMQINDKFTTETWRQHTTSTFVVDNYTFTYRVSNDGSVTWVAEGQARGELTAIQSAIYSEGTWNESDWS